MRRFLINNHGKLVISAILFVVLSYSYNSIELILISNGTSLILLGLAIRGLIDENKEKYGS